jgi:hypothetical protein
MTPSAITFTQAVWPGTIEVATTTSRVPQLQMLTVPMSMLQVY